MNTVKLSFVSLIALLIAIGATVWLATDREEWSNLRRFDPTLEVLDDPILLLSIAANTHKNVDSPIEMRQEALRALLKLQQARFGMHVSPPSEQGISLDHIYLAGESSAATGTVTLIATPSKHPDLQAPEGDYWLMEKLAFEASGQLLNRAAYTNTTAAQ